MLENKNKNLTKLEDLGEFNLIDLLTKDLKIKHKSTIKSIGDDARRHHQFLYRMNTGTLPPGGADAAASLVFLTYERECPGPVRGPLRHSRGRISCPRLRFALMALK